MARKKLLTESEIRRFMKLASMRPLGASKMQEMGGHGYQPGARDEEEMDLDAEIEGPAGEEDVEMDLEDEGGEEEMEMDVEEEGGGDTVSIDDFVAALEQAVEEVTGQPTTADLETGGEEEVEGEEEMEMDLEEPGGEEELEAGEEELTLQESRAWRRRRLKEGTTKGEKTEKGELAYEDPSKGEEDEPEEGPKAKSPGYRPKAYGQKSSVNEDSGAEEGEHYERNRDADDAHIAAIEHHLDALKHDRDYDDRHIDESRRDDAVVNEVSRRVALRLSKRNKNDQLAEQLADRIMRRLTK
jgi:hypothetical protein